MSRPLLTRAATLALPCGAPQEAPAADKPSAAAAKLPRPAKRYTIGQSMATVNIGRASVSADEGRFLYACGRAVNDPRVVKPDSDDIVEKHTQQGNRRMVEILVQHLKPIGQPAR